DAIGGPMRIKMKLHFLRKALRRFFKLAPGQFARIGRHIFARIEALRRRTARRQGKKSCQ
ncbi:MAG TPA: hypothetical protein PKC74_02505, partial [Turneriella sp.]|nr:hypothetical protein [Turneriella sp.]